MKNLVDMVKDGAKSLSDGVKVGAKSLAGGVKKHARNAVVYTAIGAAALGGVGKAYGETVPDFAYFIGQNGTFSTVENFIEFQYPFGYDNLMIRDPNGVASTVSKDGALEGGLWVGDVWRIGFIKYDGGNMLVGGYANNNNNNSNSSPGILGGWCSGIYTDAVLGDGIADDVLIIHDKLGNGIGDVVGGEWYQDLEGAGGDNVHYWTKDIEFNGIQGDISQLGTFNGDTKILPQMTIDARPPRTGSAGMNELADLAYHWLASDCSPELNGDCDGADWNYDGKVNLVDFSYMAQGWDPSYVSE